MRPADNARPGDRAFLAAHVRPGYSLDSFERQEKQALFSTSDVLTAFPSNLKPYMQKHVDAMRNELEQETDPDWRSAIQANLPVRQDVLHWIEKADERPASAGSN